MRDRSPASQWCFPAAVMASLAICCLASNSGAAASSANPAIARSAAPGAASLQRGAMSVLQQDESDSEVVKSSVPLLALQGLELVNKTNDLGEQVRELRAALRELKSSEQPAGREDMLTTSIAATIGQISERLEKRATAREQESILFWVAAGMAGLAALACGRLGYVLFAAPRHSGPHAPVVQVGP